MYQLSPDEKQRLEDGIRAAYAVPFVDDIKDFIWEAVLSYVKKDAIALDPLTDEDARMKKLYDVVDPVNHIGWSAKSLQVSSLHPGDEFELVIQRADVFTKAEELGYRPLNKQSDEQIIGSALLKHWHNKVDNDALYQEVDDKRVDILLKSNDRKKWVHLEDDIEKYQDDEIHWEWTDSNKRGLKGFRKSDNFCKYKWYPNQTQFFERFVINDQNYSFILEPSRIGPPSEAVEKLVQLLENKI